MYELQKSKWMKHFDFLLFDILGLICLYCVLTKLLIESPWMLVHMYVAYAIPIICTFMFAVHNFYKSILSRDSVTEFIECTKYMFFHAAGILIYLYISKESFRFSRRLFIVYIFSGVFIIFILRFLHKKIVIKRTAKRPLNFAFVTDKASGWYDSIPEEKKQYINKCAVFTDKPGENHYPYDIDEFELYRENNVIDEVFLDVADIKMRNTWLRFLLSSGLPVHLYIGHMFEKLPNAFVEKIEDEQFITTCNSVVSPFQLFLKRIMDIMGGIVGLLFTGIAFIIFAPIIKKQSPGPVFYSQIRIGRNGRRFKIYKFRSMRPDADKMKKELMEKNKIDGYMFKIDDDPRIIPIGKFMRKHSIDELPQFWNVLKGDMSLVGTRPPTLDEWEKYSPHHRARLSAKPGLTGVWQVSGRSDITNFEDVVRMDTEYINNWTILSDIKLIFMTVIVVFKGNGAA